MSQSDVDIQIFMEPVTERDASQSGVHSTIVHTSFIDPLFRIHWCGHNWMCGHWATTIAIAQIRSRIPDGNVFKWSTPFPHTQERESMAMVPEECAHVITSLMQWSAIEWQQCCGWLWTPAFHSARTRAQAPITRREWSTEQTNGGNMGIVVTDRLDTS